MELRDIHRHIEAILMVVDEPVSELTLATVLEVPRTTLQPHWLSSWRATPSAVSP